MIWDQNQSYSYQAKLETNHLMMTKVTVFKACQNCKPQI